MITEKEYIKKTNLSHRKQFAQFFTPKIIADFMAEWVLTDANEKFVKFLFIKDGFSSVKLYIKQ